MITFTDAAVKHIQIMMGKNPNAIGFRLAVKKTGCNGYSYVPAVIEKMIENDISMTVQNNLNVFIDAESFSFLKEIIVDYVETEDMGLKQKRLLFKNPNEKGRCGCGESFNV